MVLRAGSELSDDMDKAAADAPEPTGRPHRERHLPAHLADYDVGYPAQTDHPSTTPPRSHSRRSGKTRTPSEGGKANSSSSSSVLSIPRSVGKFPSQALSSIQAAILEERIKRMELEELRRQIDEDHKADLECQRLDARAKEAQRLQEEAHQAREALTKQLDRRRRLKKAENELEVAKIITSLLQEGDGAPASDPVSLAPSFLSLPVASHPAGANTPPPPNLRASTPQLQRPNPPSVLAPSPWQLPSSIAPIVTCPSPVPVLPPTAAAAIHVEPSAMPTVAPVAPSATTIPLTNQGQAASIYPPLVHYPPVELVGRSPTSAHAMPYLSQGLTRSDPTLMGPYAAAGQAAAPPLGQTPAPGIELLLASSYGIPKPTLPVFESGRESEFALLKMALDNLLSSHTHLSEQYKYQVLLGHLKLPSALQLAKAYMHDLRPYSTALQALLEKYGQPRQLVQCELGAILNAPAIKFGDADAFDAFALSVQSLVGMLRTLEGQNGYELKCGSHVDRLLSKMPSTYRDGFVEYCLSRGILQTGTDQTYTLPDLAAWLQIKAQAKRISSRAAALYQVDSSKLVRKEQRSTRPKEKALAVLLSEREELSPPESTHAKSTSKPKPYCPHCDNKEHFLNSRTEFKKLTTSQIVKWIKEGKRCWKCGRSHKAETCTLKRPCKTCKEVHLTVLHDAVQDTQSSILMVNTPPTKIYLDRPNRSPKVMLKVVKVFLHNGNKAMETYAVLDDGSERSIVLPQVVQQLNLRLQSETLSLRTVHQNVEHLKGASVTLEVSSLHKPSERYQISQAFTANGLCLSEHSYPVTVLQKRYKHLKGLPLPPIDHAQPLVLIGSDLPHLLMPIQPVCAGPPGGPIAVCTRLGWSLQGPTSVIKHQWAEQQCLRISTISPPSELLSHVERLWQMDMLPYVSEKVATRSKEDQQALTLLQTSTTRVDVDGINRYATPLLRRSLAAPLLAPKEAVLPSLRSTERRLAKDPSRAETYCKEIHKLEDAGYVIKLSQEEASQTTESWFIPHHMVHHNGKDRVVFNCSFQYQGQSLNDNLLPGPVLGPSLLGVLLRFRQHAVAVSGDIKGMFHQIHLLPTDKSVLRFIWRALRRTEEPSIYEWQVLPFGTTCSPCCAIYALQRHAQDNGSDDPGLVETVELSFYVDNCLHSTRTTEEARDLVNRLRQLLATGGFEIRQWASNIPSVIDHLPSEARSEKSEMWLSKSSTDLQEPTLGLRWNCLSDSLGYKQRPIETLPPTMRNLYKILAGQYDPLGFIIPFSTRAKVLIQDLWKEGLGWDDPIRPQSLLDRWLAWEREIPNLRYLEFPRAYAPPCADTVTATQELHVFCDASERAYGSVAYMRTVDDQNQVHVSFVLARSRVAPRKQLSMPRLELSAALTGAQLASTLQAELTVPILRLNLWSDSTTVLYWLRSQSCRYKVFVGTRVTEIQNLTEVDSWRYVDSANNPADDLTRGLTLEELTQPHRWHQGPPFLHQSPDQWPVTPSTDSEPDDSELKKSALIGTISIPPSLHLPDACRFPTWKELVQAATQSLHGAADTHSSLPINAADYITAERLLLAQAQRDSFPEEVKALKSNRLLPSDSRLATLSPEYDNATGLLRVGGRLRHVEGLEMDAIHPIVLDPQHPLTKLLIKEFDQNLHHPGAERVLAELRRRYWILRGREAIRKHQHSCRDCQHWRAKPDIPKMADLPPSRLRLYKPPFYSTGMDCFGPFTVRIGRRQEKRWGIIYKCMTTRCVHLDLLESLDSDSFLMSLRRFIARRGKPYELLSDNGTNFVGGERELREAFTSMAPHLQEQLAAQQISCRFNPPSAPHFGGTWEREVKSIKVALKVILKDQAVTEMVLRTVLIEVEGMLNAKPLGYLSSDVADPEPVTPNILLMGRRDSSLPQALYDSANLLGKRRWRHSQVLADHFWSAFIRYYLPSLQERRRWTTDGKELTVDQIVLIIDPQLPRALWLVGKVTHTYPGADGRVRTAAVQVKGKTYIRPVARLIQLPKLTDEEDQGQQLSPEVQLS